MAQKAYNMDTANLKELVDDLDVACNNAICKLDDNGDYDESEGLWLAFKAVSEFVEKGE